MSVIRVSSLAKGANIPSKHIIAVLNLIEPGKKHSASTRVDFEDQERFWQTVIRFAVLRSSAEKSRFRIM